MNNNVTVDDAIKRATWYITFPFFFIFIVSFAISTIIFLYLKIDDWRFLLSLIPTFGLSIIFAKYAKIKWQFWAFENVRNVHELEKRAIQDNILDPYESILNQSEKFEIKHKLRLDRIRKKFELDDVFHDEISIPFETKIYYSKSKNLSNLIIYFISFLFFTFCLIKSEFSFMLLLFVIVSIILIIFNLKYIFNEKTQIIINNNGIVTSNKIFYSWAEIENEGVFYYNKLRIQNQNDIKEIDISDLNISRLKLNKLMILYRARYKKMNNL
jgi:hypothetical protein